MIVWGGYHQSKAATIPVMDRSVKKMDKSLCEVPD